VSQLKEVNRGVITSRAITLRTIHAVRTNVLESLVHYELPSQNFSP
jgi:hypothetical protein